MASAQLSKERYGAYHTYSGTWWEVLGRRASQREEFGIVLQGTVMLHIGDKAYKVKKGESFYFLPFSRHYIANNTTKSAKVLWVVTPPSF